jgi:hypothetical protein
MSRAFHLHPGHRVALIVEALGLEEVGVHELGVVLVEARLEHRDYPELLGDGRANTTLAERVPDGRRGDLHAIADRHTQVPGERTAHHDAGHPGHRSWALARIR